MLQSDRNRRIPGREHLGVDDETFRLTWGGRIGAAFRRRFSRLVRTSLLDGVVGWILDAFCLIAVFLLVDVLWGSLAARWGSEEPE